MAKKGATTKKADTIKVVIVKIKTTKKVILGTIALRKAKQRSMEKRARKTVMAKKGATTKKEVKKVKTKVKGKVKAKVKAKRTAIARKAGKVARETKIKAKSATVIRVTVTKTQTRQTAMSVLNRPINAL